MVASFLDLIIWELYTQAQTIAIWTREKKIMRMRCFDLHRRKTMRALTISLFQCVILSYVWCLAGFNFEFVLYFILFFRFFSFSSAHSSIYQASSPAISLSFICSLIDERSIVMLLCRQYIYKNVYFSLNIIWLEWCMQRPQQIYKS